MALPSDAGASPTSRDNEDHEGYYSFDESQPRSPAAQLTLLVAQETGLATILFIAFPIVRSLAYTVEWAQHYGWSNNSPEPNVGYFRISAVDAYAWMAASAALVIALAAAAPLTREIGNATTDKALQLFVRKALRRGAFAGACSSFFICLGTAADGIDAVASERVGVRAADRVSAVVAPILIGMLICVGASTLSLTLSVVPKELGPAQRFSYGALQANFEDFDRAEEVRAKGRLVYLLCARVGFIEAIFTGFSSHPLKFITNPDVAKVVFATVAFGLVNAAVLSAAIVGIVSYSIDLLDNEPKWTRRLNASAPPLVILLIQVGLLSALAAGGRKGSSVEMSVAFVAVVFVIPNVLAVMSAIYWYRGYGVRATVAWRLRNRAERDRNKVIERQRKKSAAAVPNFKERKYPIFRVHAKSERVAMTHKIPADPG